MPISDQLAEAAQVADTVASSSTVWWKSPARGEAHPHPDVLAVIPAKNEAATLLDVIERCQRHASKVLVVDGHSSDSTADLAREAGAEVISDRGRGKGDAIRSAIAVADRDVMIFVDADGSHDPDDIPRIVAPILAGKADHVAGSRLIGGSSELHGGFDEFFRLMGSSFITACINRRFGVCISDSQNGFRAARTDVLKELGLREDSTTIEQEMVIKTLKKGYTIAEVPSHEYARRAGQSHIVLWRVAPRYVWSFVRYLYF